MKKLIFLALLIAVPCFGQGAPPTTLLPGTVGNTGGLAILGGYSVTTSGSTYTLAPNEWWHQGLNIAGTATTIVAPKNIGQAYDVTNSESGSITFGGSTGTVVTIAAGATVRVKCSDGTNYVQVGASGGGSVGAGGELQTADGAGGFLDSGCFAYPGLAGCPANGGLNGAFGALDSSGDGVFYSTLNGGLIAQIGFNDNSTGDVMTIATPGTPGNCVELGADGVKGVDAGTPCGSGGGGGVTSFATRTGAVTPEAGDYSAFYCPLSGCGTSVQIVYASIACPSYLDSDPNLGGGTDGTACVNAALAPATAANPILYYQDKGTTLISGAGIEGPTGGNWAITGNGGGLTQTAITACEITGGNLATFTTAANTLVAGKGLTVKRLVNCSALNGETLTILSAGLTSTQFEATVSASNVSSASENGLAVQAYGTGFFLDNGAQDLISNGHPFSSSSCDIGAGTVPARGANISISNILLNGNASAQTNYCYLIHLHDINGINISNIVAYNATKYSINLQNNGWTNVSGSTFQANGSGVANTDGIHQDGPWNDLHIWGDTFQTADDPIALNSSEGYCGPGDRTTISDSTLNDSLDAIRIYNTGVVCGNGLTPTIDTVSITNYSGSVNHVVGYFGLAYTVGPVGTLDPAITNVSWSNSTIDMQNEASGFSINENIGAITFANDNFVNWPTGDTFWGNVTTTPATWVNQLTMDHIKFIASPSSTNFPSIYAGYGGGAYTFKNLIIDGYGYYNAPGGTAPPITCLLCAVTATNLNISNIDPVNIPEVSNGNLDAAQIQNIQGDGTVYHPDSNVYDMTTQHTGTHWQLTSAGNNWGNNFSGSTFLNDVVTGNQPFLITPGDNVCLGGVPSDGSGCYTSNFVSTQTGTIRTVIHNGLQVDTMADSNLTAGTSPICPNGTGGTFVNTGCSGGISYPGAGIPNSTGSAWGTSYGVSGSGSVALTTSPTFVTPTLGAATGTSLALSNVLTVGGTTGISGSSGALYVGNGTLYNSSAQMYATSVILSNGLEANLVFSEGAGNQMLAYPITNATSGSNYASGILGVAGSYWNGTVAELDDWYFTDTPGTGTNPTSTLSLTHSGTPGTANITMPSLSVGGTPSPVCTFAIGCGVSAAITTATGGTGISAVTCTTAACTNLRGTYSMTVAAATTAETVLTLVWPTTTTAYACRVNQNGGAVVLGIGHSVATATGMTISTGLTFTAGGTLILDYSCQP